MNSIELASDWERKIMLERQREGIVKAKGEGKYLGRKATIEPAEVLALKAEGIGPTTIRSVSASYAAASTGCWAGCRLTER